MIRLTALRDAGRHPGYGNGRAPQQKPATAGSFLPALRLGARTLAQKLLERFVAGDLIKQSSAFARGQVPAEDFPPDLPHVSNPQAILGSELPLQLNPQTARHGGAAPVRRNGDLQGTAPHHRRIKKVAAFRDVRSEEHTSELQSRQYLVCRLLLEKKKKE